MKETIESLKILVIGDIMLDKYVTGTVERISPEAPVPVLDVTEESYTLGGCGNVVRNLRSLGAKVDCIAGIGDDTNGQIVKIKLNEIGANPLLFISNNRTTVKERIIAEGQYMQMLRIDREDTDKVDPYIPIHKFKNYCVDDYDMVIVSDYAKGVITKELMDFLLSQQNADIIVDPKPQHAYMYDDVFMVTPNKKEYDRMLTKPRAKFILETLGSEGMKLIDNFKNKKNMIKSKPLKIFNVSGCGDVVVAVMAVCLSIGKTPLQSAKIANSCAGWTATLPGTSVITREKFDELS